jgi:hypothetical protein
MGLPASRQHALAEDQVYILAFTDAEAIFISSTSIER